MNSTLATPIDSAPASSVQDYIALLKPRVMTLVVFTGWIGMLMAPGQLHPFIQFLTIFCIALGSGASGAINMWYDRDIDAIMQRTQHRPVPAGRVEPDDALAFGLILSVASVAFLGLATNWLAACLLVLAILFYTIVYTAILKRRTPQNIVIGGAAGAFPPLIGWAAVTGDLSVLPWLLFLITFMWTPPHFWALSLYKHDDYAKAGVPMLPVVSGLAVTKHHIMVYTLLLAATSLLPFLFGVAGWVYFAGALVLNALFIKHAWKVWRSVEVEGARAMFFFSMLYLLLLYALFPIDHLFIGG